MRHSVATHLLQNGMKLKQVALFLGHCQFGKHTNLYPFGNRQEMKKKGQEIKEMSLKPTLTEVKKFSG